PRRDGEGGDVAAPQRPRLAFGDELREQIRRRLLVDTGAAGEGATACGARSGPFEGVGERLAGTGQPGRAEPARSGRSRGGGPALEGEALELRPLGALCDKARGRVVQRQREALQRVAPRQGRKALDVGLSGAVPSRL